MLINIKKACLVVGIAANCIAVDMVFAKPIGTILEPKHRLLLARQKAKANQNIDVNDYISLEDKRDAAFDESTRECGNVNIGNIHNDNRIGQSQRSVVVINTQPVINLGGDEC